MDSVKEISVTSIDKGDRHTVIVDGRTSSLEPDSGENIALTSHSFPVKSNIETRKRLCPKETNLSTLTKIIKTEMCGDESQEELRRETVQNRYKDYSHKASPTMDIRPVQISHTGNHIQVQFSSFSAMQPTVDLVSPRFEIIQTTSNHELIYRPKSSKRENRTAKAVKKVNRRGVTNCRERERQQSVNDAFKELRSKIPTEPVDKKLSKCTILTRAIEYIKLLNKILDSYERDSIKRTSVACDPKGFERDYPAHQKSPLLNGISSPENTNSSDSHLITSDSRHRRSGATNSGVNHESKKVKNSVKFKNCDDESFQEFEFESSLEISSPSTMSSPSDTD